MIDGVVVTQLGQYADERGRILHILKSTENDYHRFGEAYCSTVYPGVVKGWHLHHRMTLNYVVIRGMIKFVLYDERSTGATKGQIQELYVGDENFVRVTVPPGIWSGFMGLGPEEAYVINMADIPHDAEEIQRMNPHSDHIPYTWSCLDR